MEVGTLTLNVADAHIYANHLEQVDLQLSREPMLPCDLVISDYLFPTPWPDGEERGLVYWLDNMAGELSLEEIKDLVSIENYSSHSFIKAPVAV